MAAPNVHLSFAVRARPQDVRLQLMPAAVTDGYTLIDELPNGFAVRRRRVPVWAIVLAVILFPLGLVFLLVRTDDDVTVALSNVYGGTGVTISGPRRRRRRLRQRHPRPSSLSKRLPP